MRGIILSIVFLMIAFVANSQNHSTIALGGEHQGMLVTSNSGLTFSGVINIREINLSEVSTPSGKFTMVDIPGFTKRYDNGKPAIPVLNQPIELPTGAVASFTVKSYDTQIIDLNAYGFFSKVLPSQPSYSKSTDPSEMIFYYDEAAYQINTFQDEALFQCVPEGIYRGTGMGSILVKPVRYNPITNELMVFTNIEFTVEFNAPNYAQYQFDKNRLYSPAFQGAYNRLPNFIPPPDKDVITKYPMKYVIVADPMFQTALQPFILWKKQKGFTVIEAYTNSPSVGTTTSSIKTYLEGLYDSGTPTNPAPTYVLFVGDVAQIPAYDHQVGSDYHVTDLYYCTYDGSSDYLPDVYYGRFSAQNVSQLTPQIDKTLQYEKFTMPSANYMDTVLMIAGVDASMASTYGNGQISYGTNNYFNAAHGIYSNTYLYPASDGSGVPAAIIQIIGKGVGYANYTAHCGSSGWSDPSFPTSSIANLNNANKYGLLVGNCCQSSKFEESECFAEKLLRIPNEGAVGYIGASDYSYWDEDYYWGVGNTSNIISNPTYAGTGLGAYDRSFHDHGEATTDWFISNGQMIHAGNLAVSASTSSMKQYYWEEYHLMGDPSVMNYFSKPDPLTISYAPESNVGETSLIVNTEQYTYVAISLNGVLLDAKYTGTNNSVTLNFPAFTSVDTALVVATKQNKIAHIGNLPIVDIQEPLDAQVLQIINPQSNYSCTGIQVTPQVVLKNRGLTTLTAANINYRLNGGTLQTYSWSGSLATNASVTVSLTPFTLPAGNSSFIAYVTSPNGGVDGNHNNDSINMAISAQNLTISADFSANLTSACTNPLTVTFTNNSQNGNGYLWDFGDGTTSTSLSPVHVYSDLGYYTVTLVADGGACGSDEMIRTDYIQIGAQPPVVSDTSHCGPASFDLSVSGSGTINWYDALTGGNLLTTGTTYTTPTLSTTTNYYICSSLTNAFTGGLTTNAGTGGYYTQTTAHGIIFNCTSPVKLTTVKVYSGAAGPRTITLQNAAGTVLQTASPNIPNGESVVTLNFNIPVGTGLKLMGPGSPNLYRNGSTSGPNLYPISVGSAISLTQSTAAGYESQYYYYFYDWHIEQTCQSAMQTLVASIFDVPLASFTSFENGLEVTFTNTSTGGGSYLWDFGDGSTSTEINPVHLYSSEGEYVVTLTITNDCGNDESSSNISVNGTGVIENDPSFVVYPNPASGLVNISGPESIQYYQMFDVRGRLVKSEQVNANSFNINIAGFSEGVYYVRLNTAFSSSFCRINVR